MRVLIVRVGALGDVLHALPAVAALRRAIPEAVIDWVVDPRWAPVLVTNEGRGPVVDTVHLAQTRLWTRAPLSRQTLTSVLGLRRAVQGQRYDAVVDMQGTLRSAVIGRWATGVLAGYRDPREGPAGWMYQRRVTRTGTHVVDQGATLLGTALGMALAPQAPELPCVPLAEGWAGDVAGGGGRVALLAPTAGWGAKQWPSSRFAELAVALRDLGWRVLVNTPPGGDRVCEGVIERSGGAATSVPCTVAQMVALVRRMDVVVGGDSGPVHLSAALGTPVVGLYGPTDPARNGPWGPGRLAVLRGPASVTTYKRTAEVDPGLATMTAQHVLQAIEQVTG